MMGSKTLAVVTKAIYLTYKYDRAKLSNIKEQYKFVFINNWSNIGEKCI
jgi:hypothetical protein